MMVVQLRLKVQWFICESGVVPILSAVGCRKGQQTNFVCQGCQSRGFMTISSNNKLLTGVLLQIAGEGNINSNNLDYTTLLGGSEIHNHPLSVQYRTIS